MPPELPDERRAMWWWRQARMDAVDGLPAHEEIYRRAITAGEWFDPELGISDLEPRRLFTMWLRRSGRIEEANDHLQAIAVEGAQRLRGVRDLMTSERKTYRYSYGEQSARRGVWLAAQEELAHVLAAQGSVEEAARWWRIASEDPWCSLDLSLPRSVIHAAVEDTEISAVLWHLRERLLPRVGEQLADYIRNFDGRLPGTAADDLDAARSYRFLDWLLRGYLAEWLDLAGQEVLATRVASVRNRVTGAAQAASLPQGLDLPPGRSLQEGTGAPWMLTMEYGEVVHAAQEADSAMRSALQDMGLDAAPDLQGTDVPDATVAVSHRILSGDPLWIAMWCAAEEADLGTWGAAGCPVRDARPWQGPWAQLWDEVSCAAWDAAQGAALDVARRLGPQGNVGGALRLLFTRTARQCTHQLVALYGELVELR